MGAALGRLLGLGSVGAEYGEPLGVIFDTLATEAPDREELAEVLPFRAVAPWAREAIDKWREGP